MSDSSTFIPKDKRMRYARAQTLGSFLTPVLTTVCQKQGFVSASIILDWSKIVGEALAGSCQALKIVFPLHQRVNGCLHIQATSSMATTLTYYQDIILQKVNQYYGYQAVTRIRIFHNMTKPVLDKKKEKKPSFSSAPDPLVEETVTNVPYDPLQSALRELGREIIKNEEK